MDLSYAQHLEDYHLAQAFGHQREGFYIDVGAGHPVADNVSCWFYQRGWRGIVVEPQPQLAELYASVRPRDIAECCVLGAAEGEVEFHDVERLHGFSTIVPEFAESATGFGARYATRKVPMKTLAGVCEAHGVPRIDFLKVDVEGAEAQVLMGGDWTRHRPRVVVCEALAPGSLAENWLEGGDRSSRPLPAREGGMAGRAAPRPHQSRALPRRSSRSRFRQGSDRRLSGHAAKA